MPIKIPDDLPARQTLEEEGVLVIREHDAIRQDIRPMRIALLNLMPEKIKTETQIARVVGSTPLQVEMTLVKTASYKPTNTPEEHMLAFYEPWHNVADQKFDGLIVTGAPVEEMDFEDVDYWSELTEVFDWARTNVFRTFNICWGGQAALYHYYGVPKYTLSRKLSGVYMHEVVYEALGPLFVLAEGIEDPVAGTAQGCSRVVWRQMGRGSRGRTRVPHLPRQPGRRRPPLRRCGQHGLPAER